MIRGAIYYTDFNVDPYIMQICQEQIKKNFDSEIISVSLKNPLSFGRNIVLKNKERGCVTMIMQILMALEASTADYVFFLEHDCLYPASHFEFVPFKNDMFYYDSNNLRWDYPKDRLITYDRLISLSGLCANREYLLKHYKERLGIIEANGWDKDKRHEPDWARRMGYEPGTKKKKRGGYFDDDFEIWRSEYPMIDIRHNKTFSQPKVTLESFKHQPINWQEISLEQVSGWDLKKLFNL